MQDVDEANINEFEPNGSISLTPFQPSEISVCYADPNRAPDPPWTPKYDWAVTLAVEPWGIIQKEEGDDETFLCFGSFWCYSVPVSAPTIALSAAGLSILIIVLALLARKRWRRAPAASQRSGRAQAPTH